MKRYLLLIISIVCLAASAQEQAHSSRRPRMTSEEFQTKQKEFIARHAELTEEESSAIFPLYFELQDKKHQVNANFWKKVRAMKSQECTEQEYYEAIDDWADVKIECATLEKEYIKRFEELLPAKKLMRVLIAEDRFQREILRNMQQGGDKRPEKKQ